MREIKFRAWDTAEKCMWYNQFAITSSGIFHEFGPAREYFCHHPNNNIILLQFTGLLDSEGKEIFEGDVVEFHKKEGESFPDTIFTGLIEFSEFYTDGPCQVGDIVLGWNIKIDDRTRWSLLEIINDNSHFTNLTVIGNIYENPDLLQP